MLLTLISLRTEIKECENNHLIGWTLVLDFSVRSSDRVPQIRFASFYWLRHFKLYYSELKIEATKKTIHVLIKNNWKSRGFAKIKIFKNWQKFTSLCQSLKKDFNYIEWFYICY